MKTGLIWILALLMGALVPALMVVLAGYDLGLFQPAFLITFSHMVVLGLPALLLYRSLGLTKARWVMLGGFAIGALPSAMFFWDERTSWLDHVQLVGGLGCLGALGAFTCWLVFRLTGLLPR